MPIYEYRCQKCGHELERMQRMADPPLSECPECGGELKKLMSAPSFQFKGTGWYVTDYARKGAGKPSEGGAGGGDPAKSDKSDKADKADKSDKPAKADKGAKDGGKSGGAGKKAAAAKDS